MWRDEDSERLTPLWSPRCGGGTWIPAKAGMTTPGRYDITWERTGFEGVSGYDVCEGGGGGVRRDGNNPCP